jgi:uncharacterized protein YbbC (DUF1343 family)
VTRAGVLTRVALLAEGFNLVKLFSPEHGLGAAGADGEYQPHGIDTVTGLPITSLYGDQLAPGQNDLAGLDFILFDMPDVGARFYTYLWTMTYIMEACASNHIPLLVTDRPNPTGCNLHLAEGPMLDETSCASFIGRWRMPIRHSCTLGELARYFKATRVQGLDLQVIPVRNYTRDQLDGFGFTPTSPAIRHPYTPLLYAGMCLLEGINVNEGRGTDFPFEVCAAPWINSKELSHLFNKLHPPGVVADVIAYVASEGLYANEMVYGLRIRVTDNQLFRPVATVIALIQCLFQLYPLHLQERLYPTIANPGGGAHLDKLLGIRGAFDLISSGATIDTEITAEWKAEVQPHLLYH